MTDKLELGDLERDIFKISNMDRPFLVKIIAHLDKSFFETKILSKTFAIYKVFFEKFGKVPTERILKKELTKTGESEERVNKLVEYIYNNDINELSGAEREYIVDKVTKLSKRKRIEEAVFNITDVLAKEEDLEDEDFEHMESKFRDALKYSMNVNIGQDLYDIDDRYQAILDSVQDKITTGFDQIDHVLYGGFAKKELIAFQAPPGVGKCSHYDSEIEIEIDTDDPLYQKVKHLFENSKRSRVKIGDLVESLGAINEGDDVSVNSTLKVNSPFGYKSIESVHKTQLNPEWEIETKSGKKTVVADKHRLETRNGWFDESNDRYWTFAEDLEVGDEIYTKDGWDKVVRCEFNGKHSAMYDLQVIDTHSYYADDIHGHNTIWLVNIGFNMLKHGYNVVHYSMEMSEERLGLRYDAVATKIATKELTSSIDEVKAKYDTLKKITQSRLKLKEFPTSMASIYDIEAHLEHLRLQENFIPDAIIVDYGDIMRSTRQTKNLYEEQGWIFRELRGLAVKQNVVGVTATQSNRGALKEDGGTSEMIGMDKTADSMEKNRILDVLFSVTQSRQEKDDGKINLWVAKNRNGEANRILEFLINYRNMAISEKSPGV